MKINKVKRRLRLLGLVSRSTRPLLQQVSGQLSDQCMDSNEGHYCLECRMCSDFMGIGGNMIFANSMAFNYLDKFIVYKVENI